MEPPIKNIFALEPSQEQNQMCTGEDLIRFQNGLKAGVHTNRQTDKQTFLHCNSRDFLVVRSHCVR